MMSHRQRITSVAALFGVVSFATFAVAQRGQHSERPHGRPVKRVIVTLPPSNLNQEQKYALRDLRKMIDKLFGHTGRLPGDAEDLFRRTVWNALNGVRTPDRARTNQFADFLIEAATKQAVIKDTAVELVKRTAELLSDPNETLAQEHINAYELRIRLTLATTQIPMAEQSKRLQELMDLIANANFGVAQLQRR